MCRHDGVGGGEVESSGGGERLKVTEERERETYPSCVGVQINENEG